MNIFYLFSIPLNFETLTSKILPNFWTSFVFLLLHDLHFEHYRCFGYVQPDEQSDEKFSLYNKLEASLLYAAYLFYELLLHTIEVLNH